MVANSKILIDILIKNASIITMDGQRRQLSNASIAINDGIIIDLAPSLEFEDRYKPRHEVLNAKPLQQYVKDNCRHLTDKGANYEHWPDDTELTHGPCNGQANRNHGLFVRKADTEVFRWDRSIHLLFGG